MYNENYNSSWCQSLISKRLVQSGCLFPHLLRELLEGFSGGQFADFGDLQRKVGLPLRLANYLLALLGEEVKFGIPSRARTPWDAACQKVGMKTYLELYEAWSTASERRPAPAILYGQRYITGPSAVNRAVLASSIFQKFSRVVFLGDDDFCSLVLARLRPDLSVTVVDIDAEMLGALSSGAGDLGLDVELCHRNLFDSVPGSLQGNFDGFVADPFPTSEAAFEMSFVSRGFELSGQHGVGLVTCGPTHKQQGFGEIFKTSIRQVGMTIDRELPPSECEYEVILHELTSLEEERLLEIDAAGSAFSHGKGYLILRRGDFRGQDVDSQDLSSWIQMTLSHDLSARLGGRRRLAEEALRAVNQDLWSKCIVELGVPEARVDPSMMLADLVGKDALEKLWTHCLDLGDEEFGEVLSKAVDGSIPAEEGAALSRAVRIGPRTDWITHAIDFELYLVSRLYESYFRGLGRERCTEA